MCWVRHRVHYLDSGYDLREMVLDRDVQFSAGTTTNSQRGLRIDGRMQIECGEGTAITQLLVPSYDLHDSKAWDIGRVLNSKRNRLHWRQGQTSQVPLHTRSSTIQSAQLAQSKPKGYHTARIQSIR